MSRTCRICLSSIEGRPPQATLCFPCIPLAKKENDKKWIVLRSSKRRSAKSSKSKKAPDLADDKRPRKGWMPKSSQPTNSTYFVNNRSYIEQLIDRIDAIDAELSR